MQKFASIFCRILKNKILTSVKIKGFARKIFIKNPTSFILNSSFIIFHYNKIPTFVRIFKKFLYTFHHFQNLFPIFKTNCLGANRRRIAERFDFLHNFFRKNTSRFEIECKCFARMFETFVPKLQ